MIQTILSGYLCADPRINDTPSGSRVANLRVAGNFRAKGDDGQYESQALFFDVEIWRSVDAIETHFHKGSGIEVAGELQERSWTDKDGNLRTTLIIRNAQWSFPPKSDGNGNGKTQAQAQRQREAAPAQGGLAAATLGDDDIPF
jgi:single stranded DNA-binding protein